MSSAKTNVLRDKMSLKVYIEGFFEFYNYNKEDAEVLIDAYEKIANNSETFVLLNQIMDLYDESINCDYNKMVAIADEIAAKLYLHEYTVEFLMFVCLSKRAGEVYDLKGIAREIFHGNMFDLKYKLDECKLVYNIVGSFVPEWFVGFFNATRVTLGRLQYEINIFNKEYSNNGRTLTPGCKVLNMHIPRSLKPLDEKSCEESYAMAKEFFKSEFDEEIPFYCHSWLLYPENKKILSEKSNTYRFMSRFETISEHVDKHRSHLWRIFDTTEKCPDKLPENTLIQKAFKTHLQNGGKMGVAEGVFFLKNDK